MLKTLLTFLFIAILAGCSSTSKPASYPQWYLNPPQSSSTTLYGVGSGEDLVTAKNSALSAIASYLSVRIESHFEKSDRSIRTNSGEQTLQDVLNTVQADTKALTFSNVKVEQNSVMNDTVLLLLSVDRVQLFNEQKKRLDTELISLKTEIANAAALSVIERFIILKKVRKAHVGIASATELLSAIKPGFNSASYLDFIATNNSQFDALKHAMQLRILSDTDATLFRVPITDALTAEGIKVDDKNTLNSKNIIIELSASTQQDTLYGYKIEQLRLNVSTKTVAGKVVALRQHTFSGKSRYNFLQARHHSVSKLKQMILNEGIFTVLGL